MCRRFQGILNGNLYARGREVRQYDRQSGVVTTGYHSISLGKSLCFALVDTAYSALGTALRVRIRKNSFPGVVVKKRFYQTNYKK